MKKVYGSVLIVLLMTTLFGCKKENDKAAADASQNNLIGYWELAESSGAMVPPTMYPAGNGKILVLTTDTYAYYGNGQLVKKGTYMTMADNTIEQNVCLVNLQDKYDRRIVFDTAYSAPKQFFNIADEQLSIISGCYTYDAGHKIIYRRIKPNGTFPLE
jgi:hypothetical protein